MLYKNDYSLQHNEYASMKGQAGVSIPNSNNCSFIHPFSRPLNPVQGHGGLVPIPVVSWQEIGYTLDGSPVHFPQSIIHVLFT